MVQDPAQIRDEAAIHGWVARTEAFEPHTPLQDGIQHTPSRWFTRIFKGVSTGPVTRRRAAVGAIVPGTRNWRDAGVVTFPEHQEDVCACASYATCAMANARARISGKDPAPLAPRYLHFCSMKRDLKTGVDIQLLAETALSTGLPVAFEGLDALRAQAACPALPTPSPMRVAAFYSFDTAEEVKQEIALHGPVMAIMDLREDFIRWYGTGVYRSTGTPRLGSHAVCLIGYDDGESCWIGKNSFGTGWGDGGFFRLAYGDSGVLTSRGPAYSLDLR